MNSIIGMLKKMEGLQTNVEGLQTQMEDSQPQTVNYSPSLVRASKSIIVNGLKFGMIGYAIIQIIKFIESREFINPTKFVVTSLIGNAMKEAAYFVWWLGKKALGSREQCHNTSDSSTKCLKLKQWIWKTIDSVEDCLVKVALKIDQVYSDCFGIRRFKDVKDLTAKDLYLTEGIRKAFLEIPFAKRILDIISFKLTIGATEWLLKGAVVIPIKLNTLYIYPSLFILELAVKVMSLFNSYIIKHLIELLELNEKIKLFQKDFSSGINHSDRWQNLNEELGKLMEEVINFERKWPLYKDKWNSAYKSANFRGLAFAFGSFQNQLTNRLNGNFSPESENFTELGFRPGTRSFSFNINTI